MISIYELLAILLIHWVADFHLQTHWQATNKSSNNQALTEHILVYSFIWLSISGFYIALTGNWLMILFAPFTYISHWTTDYFTSRQVKKRFDKQDYHNGFVWIGFDQILHYTQLFLTYILLR